MIGAVNINVRTGIVSLAQSSPHVLQASVSGKVLQQVIAVCGGEHHRLEEPLRESDVPAIERSSWRIKDIASGKHLRHVREQNPSAPGTTSDG